MTSDSVQGERKGRVIWTDQEKEDIIKAGVELLIEEPTTPVSVLIIKAQEKALPVQRHRDIYGSHSREPWMSLFSTMERRYKRYVAKKRGTPDPELSEPIPTIRPKRTLAQKDLPLSDPAVKLLEAIQTRLDVIQVALTQILRFQSLQGATQGTNGLTLHDGLQITHEARSALAPIVEPPRGFKVVVYGGIGTASGDLLDELGGKVQVFQFNEPERLTTENMRDRNAFVYTRNVPPDASSLILSAFPKDRIFACSALDVPKVAARILELARGL